MLIETVSWAVINYLNIDESLKTVLLISSTLTWLPIAFTPIYSYFIWGGTTVRAFWNMMDASNLQVVFGNWLAIAYAEYLISSLSLSIKKHVIFTGSFIVHNLIAYGFQQSFFDNACNDPLIADEGYCDP